MTYQCYEEWIYKNTECIYLNFFKIKNICTVEKDFLSKYCLLDISIAYFFNKYGRNLY